MKQNTLKFKPIKRIMNSKTTTIKYPTPEGDFKRPLMPELRHDALTAILNSTNLLRGGYDLNDEDFSHINKVRENIMHEVMLLENYLLNRRSAQ